MGRPDPGPDASEAERLAREQEAHEDAQVRTMVRREPDPDRARTRAKEIRYFGH